MRKVPLNELTEAQVSHISLVDRGANREPFRIVKREEDGQMLDFSNGIAGMFRKTDDRAPAIVAVAFAKQFDPKAAAEILGEAGLSFGDPQDTDAANIYPIEGATLEVIEKAILFKLNDEIGFAVDFGSAVPERVAKGYVGYDFESTDFKTVVGTNKSLPMINVAMSGLQDVIWNIMSNSDTVDVAKGDIKKAVKDFSGMVMDIVENIPATAFKLEAAVHKAAAVKKTENGDQKADTVKKGEEAPKKDEPAPTGQPTEELERRTTAEPTEAEKEGEKATIDAEKEGEAGEGDKTETKKGEGEVKTDPPAPAPDVAAIAAAVMKGLEPQLTEMGSKLSSFGETVTSLKGEVAATAKNLKKVDESFNLGIVGGDQEDGDGDDETETVHKVDLKDGEEANDEGFLVLDTGYSDPFPEYRGKSVQAN
jgi:hypothetical protein